MSEEKKKILPWIRWKLLLGWKMKVGFQSGFMFP